MKTIDQALQAIAESVYPIETTELRKVSEAHGDILAEDVRSSVDVPAFDRSAMDGFAVSTDISLDHPAVLPVEFRILETNYAGGIPKTALIDNEACRVSTGAMLPENTTCVLRREDVVESGGYILLQKPQEPGCHMIARGEDIRRGEILLPKRTTLDAHAIALLLSADIHQVRVYRHPKILVLATGDELVEPGKPLEAGKIYNTNNTLVCLRLREWGFPSDDGGIVPDDLDALKKKISKAARSYDLIITTGGMSVGDRDFVPTACRALEGIPTYEGISIRPGGHTAHYRLGTTDIIALSGNPFALTAMMELTVREILWRMTGKSSLHARQIEATLGADLSNPKPLPRIFRGTYDDATGQWIPSSRQNASTLAEHPLSDSLVILPANAEQKAGTSVRIRIIR